MKPGEPAERWLAEHSNLRPTCASGAKFLDADFKNSDRIYEVKSSVRVNGIKIDKKHVNVLLQRAKKLDLEPVFIFLNRQGSATALVPYSIFAMAAAEEPQNWMRLMYDPIVVKGRGNTIFIPEDALREANLPVYGVIIFEDKEGKKWVASDAELWLRLVGDHKYG